MAVSICFLPASDCCRCRPSGADCWSKTEPCFTVFIVCVRRVQSQKLPKGAPLSSGSCEWGDPRHICLSFLPLYAVPSARHLEGIAQRICIVYAFRLMSGTVTSRIHVACSVCATHAGSGRQSRALLSGSFSDFSGVVSVCDLDQRPGLQSSSAIQAGAVFERSVR